MNKLKIADISVLSITVINFIGFFTTIIPPVYFLSILAVCALYTYGIRTKFVKK